MLAVIAVLILLAILFGAVGVSVHFLWTLAVICLIAAVVVFLVRGSRSGL